MTIEAPYSKHNRTSFLMYTALCVGVAVVFAYDGYLSQYEWSHRRTFYEAHNKVVLFRAGGQLQEDLDRGLVSQDLRRKFMEAKTPLSEAAVASTEEAGQRWVIVDQAARYPVAKEEAGWAVYTQGPDETMIINKVAPFILVLGAAILGVRFWSRKDTKIVADENELIVAGKERIPYDAIEKIDKTYFDKKGFFTIVYRKGNSGEGRLKLSDRDYDNLGPILDHLIAKIT